MKIKWRVSEAPTGRYRSFESRAWPSANYDDKEESSCANILCEDEYRPSEIKTGNHKELTVMIAFYNNKEDRKKKGWFTWRVLKKRFATLKEAKDGALMFINTHPEIYENKDVK